MYVAALLPPAAARHLQQVVLGTPHRVERARGWAELAALLRGARVVDLVVVDPVLDGVAAVREVMQLSQQHPSIPIVLYTGFSPTAMRATVDLGAHGLHHVVLRGMDDGAASFGALLTRLVDVDLSEEVLRALAEPLDQLDPGVAAAIMRLFRHPAELGSVEALALASGISRRTLYRALDEVGLAHPAALIQAARLARTYVHLGDRTLSVEDVARRVGFRDKNRLRIRVRAAFGVRTRQLRRMPRLSFVRAVVTLALAAPGDTPPRTE